ncbi:putative serine protease 47 [Camelus ferus]|uniref:tryptase n=1 Tax=Camelus ferus TaxID=419612 RepID=A0A8B8S477_CAMFR|nr:putative serine protease 47 [Camelus ferus]
MAPRRLRPACGLPLAAAAAASGHPGAAGVLRHGRGFPGSGTWGTSSVSVIGGRGVSTVCGKPKVIGKVYGSQNTVVGQWPWQASLLYQGSHVCGATLINSRWLVSAAHCFLKKSQFLENYRVLLGNTQLYQHTRHTQKIPVSQIIVYPDFDKFHPFGNDIAMLQLLFPVNFTSYIIPACLPAPCMQLPSNSSCWITGWGMLSEERPLLEPFRLQEGKGGLVENKFCNMLYEQRVGQGRNYSVHEGMLCAGDFSTEKAICRGDSGGPLVCNLTDAWVLVGLASWGLDCRHPIYPSVFTNVSYFIDWMDEIQRLTPLRDAMSAPPQTQFPHQPLQAAGLPGPGTGFVPPQPWPLLLFLLQAPRQALW